MTEQKMARLGELLRKVRRDASISQLELALRLGVSQRHVSFVERGRSGVGRALLASWLSALETPLPVRNAVMLHAGFMPADDGIAPTAAPVHVDENSLHHLIEVHDPFPAFIFNADWHMTALNRGGRALCAILMPHYWANVPDPRAGMDMIDAITSPQGLLSQMDNAAEAAALLLQQLRMEEWARPALRARVDAFEESVLARYGGKCMAFDAASLPPLRAMRLRFSTRQGELAFCTLQNVIGLPQNVNLDAFRMELWFPADEQTRSLMTALTGALETGG